MDRSGNKLIFNETDLALAPGLVPGSIDIHDTTMMRVRLREFAENLQNEGVEQSTTSHGVDLIQGNVSRARAERVLRLALDIDAESA